MPTASVSISSQSRKKLKTYHYVPVEYVTDHENANGGRVPSKKIDGFDECTAKTETDQIQNQKSACPQTPRDKIPLADLIANPEDSLHRLISSTPKERIEWQVGPRSSETLGSAAIARRGTKRTHSSPLSASQSRQDEKLLEDREPFDLDSISRSLHTPRQDDPVLVLWDRYARTRERRDDEPVLPPLPPMSSSPTTPGSNRTSDGLRRTVSCGVEWPTTSTKRKKSVNKYPLCRTKGIFAARKDAILAKDIARNSRMSLLVDSIHQTLKSKSLSEQDVPSSSSPLPHRYEGQQVLPTDLVADAAKPDVRADTALLSIANREHSNDHSSDYGDVDLDLYDPDLVEALEQARAFAANTSPGRPASVPEMITSNSLQPPILKKSETVPDELFLDQMRTDGLPAPVSNTQRSEQQLHQPEILPNRFSDDSLDDFDDDTFTAELVDLVEEVDSQNVVVSKHPLETLPKGSDAAPTIQLDEFDDIFDDDDAVDDDVWQEIDGITAVTAPPIFNSMSQKLNDNRAIKRYLVTSVSENTYSPLPGQTRQQKTLIIKDERSHQRYVIQLRQSWYDTRCTKSSHVHLIGEFDNKGECIVDDKDNMLILHPDHLISATVVADSFTCIRRATLQDRIKATSAAEPAQVYGHLIHEVFGQALQQNRWEVSDLEQIVLKIIPSYIEPLYEINVQVQDAVEYVMSKMPQLKGWASVFISPELVTDSVIRDRKGGLIPTVINKLLELEEHVWSPMYGLKGNIDATVQAQMKLPSELNPHTLTLPLELKTGKRDTNEMHRAQTALYTLLLSDRYDINVTSGILYYLETCKTFRVEGIRNEIRHMIIQRNELASYVHDKLSLPPLVKKEHLCKKCYAQTSCFAYHKLVEDGDGESSGLRDLFHESVGHLKQSQQAFFKKWDELLTKEERDAMKFKRELWTMLSVEREAIGRCFSEVVIEPGSAVESTEGPKINRFTYSFVKNQTRPGFSFTESQITVGEPIVVSDEKGHFALANGYVTHVRPARITVAVDRKLQNARIRQPGFDARTNQVFSTVMDVNGDAASAGVTNAPTVYRIDKDEFANGMATARNNVLKIMEKGLWRARELRQLIIELRAPTFKSASTAYTLSGPASQQNINVDQRRAIEKVMSARDYALVLGMPGTGKTTTIAHIIRALVSQGKSVLLTSYTHTAVDNILLKIKDDSIPILRLGALGKIHPDVQAFADLGSIPKKTVAELEASWTKSKVVATTCLGINHAIFNHRKFDYCIVDEASQITLPVCLGPVRLASAFILVGDHYQLPPLVQNKEAQEGGLDVSLFKLLSDAQPDSVVNLEHQYRMAEDIQLLSNELIYSGRLKCGTSAVASRLLHVPALGAGLDAHHQQSTAGVGSCVHTTATCARSTMDCWLSRALDPAKRNLFLNTDRMGPQPAELGAPETVSGSGTRITNVTEAMLIAQMLTVLVRAGVSPRSIGVITFYRSQLALLKTTVKSLAGSAAAADIEMHTADKYQGRDKEVILLSCVRSNTSCHVGELLKDWRRVNVALTRARSKLITIGSLRTLQGCNVAVWKGLCRIMLEKGWVLDLPEQATEGHLFESGSSSDNGRKSKLTQTKHTRSPETGETTAVAADKGPTRKALSVASGNIMNRPKMRRPDKVANGPGLDRMLDDRPIMRNVLDEIDFQAA